MADRTPAPLVHWRHTMKQKSQLDKLQLAQSLSTSFVTKNGVTITIARKIPTHYDGAVIHATYTDENGDTQRVEMPICFAVQIGDIVKLASGVKPCIVHGYESGAEHTYGCNACRQETMRHVTQTIASSVAVLEENE